MVRLWMRGWALLALVAVGLLVDISPARADTMTFSNSTPISIADLGNATPYPSTIAVSGLAGIITDVSVTLNDFSHTHVDDVGIMLVGPTGAGIVIFNGGISGAAGPINPTFVDGGMFWPRIDIPATANYQPTSYYPDSIFPAPAPLIPGVNPTAGSFGGTPYFFSVFDGTNPNGTWSLYVQDFVLNDSGSIAGGWSLTITTDTQVIPEPASLTLLAVGAVAAVGYRWRRRRQAV